jgi:hypothetical protein
MPTVAADEFELTPDPPGPEPVAVATFVMLPAVRSACVTVYVPVHVID